MKTNGLKGCPFYGSDKTIFARDINGELRGIYCTGCKCKVSWEIPYKSSDTFGDTEEKWRKRYNRRELEDDQ